MRGCKRHLSDVNRMNRKVPWQYSYVSLHEAVFRFCECNWSDGWLLCLKK